MEKARLESQDLKMRDTLVVMVAGVAVDAVDVAQEAAADLVVAGNMALVVTVSVMSPLTMGLGIIMAHHMVDVDLEVLGVVEVRLAHLVGQVV